MITVAIFSFPLRLTCSCGIGKNGSPCHHAAIVFHCNIESVNFASNLHPFLCQDIAFLVLGNKASKTIEFYSALHEEIKPASTTENIATTNTSDCTGTSWDRVRARSLDDTIASDSDNMMILDLSKRQI